MDERAGGVRDVVVVGGGAAGLSGALTLARARRRVTVVDAGEPRNAPADGVHGLLALDGVSPVELLARGRDEVLGYGGVVGVDVVVVPPRMMVPTAPFLGIGIKAAPHPAGAFVEADAFGKTAVPGVWVAGNASDLSAQVSAAAAEGARAAQQINADLVMEDIDRALAALAAGPTSQEDTR